MVFYELPARSESEAIKSAKLAARHDNYEGIKIDKVYPSKVTGYYIVDYTIIKSNQLDTISIEISSY